MNKETFASIFPIRGWKIVACEIDSPEGSDFDIHGFTVEKNTENRAKLTLTSPRARNGMYEVNGIYRVPIHTGRRGADFCRKPGRMAGIAVTTPEQAIALGFRAAISKGLVGQANQWRMQASLDTFFATSPAFRSVDPWNAAQVQMAKDTIHIDLMERSTDPTRHLVVNWLGYVDPFCTPQGNKIMQTYQIARNAHVDPVTHRMKAGDLPFSAEMGACLLFPEFTPANRIMTARTAMQYRELLVDTQEPWAAHTTYKIGTLSGCHLLTAIAAHPMGFADCLVVSESAAKKMRCYRFGTYQTTDVFIAEPAVQIGEQVRTGQPLINVQDNGTLVSQIVLDNPTFTEVFRAEQYTSRIAGQHGHKARVTVFGEVEMEDGDKVTTRHGTKGCVRIVPDEDMPATEDGHAEILVHPKSIQARCAFGVLWEMAANRKCKAEGKPIRIPHMSGVNKQLLQEGWCSKTQTRDGRSLFMGPLYWLRLDKHASDGLSVVREPAVNFAGLVVNSGKRGGQRLGLDVRMALKAKGLQDEADALYARNAGTEAERMATRLMACLAATHE